MAYKHVLSELSLFRLLDKVFPRYDHRSEHGFKVRSRSGIIIIENFGYGRDAISEAKNIERYIKNKRPHWYVKRQYADVYVYDEPFEVF